MHLNYFVLAGNVVCDVVTSTQLHGYSLGWKHCCRLWSEHLHQSRFPPSLLIQADKRLPWDSRPWGRSGSLAQLACVAAWAYTSEHQGSERTSEAPDQAPEVEAHIWAGISAEVGKKKKKFRTVTVSINCAVVWLLRRNNYLRICRWCVCVRRCLRRHLHSRRVYRCRALLRVHSLLWIRTCKSNI